MGRRKKSFVEFKGYEGKRPKDTFIRITTDMMRSEVFRELSPSAIKLYLFMKEWSKGNTEFEYSWSLARNHNLFRSNNTYIKAKNELIKYGFIECIRTCKCSRQPNKYSFSNKWHKK